MKVNKTSLEDILHSIKKARSTYTQDQAKDLYQDMKDSIDSIRNTRGYGMIVDYFQQVVEEQDMQLDTITQKNIENKEIIHTIQARKIAREFLAFLKNLAQ